MESSLRDGQREHALYRFPKQELDMRRMLKFVFLAAVAAIGISSPVLAAVYNDPALNGGGSSGYNAHLGADNS
jgi:hypothetical protein